MLNLGLDLGTYSVGWAIIEGHWSSTPIKDLYFKKHSKDNYNYISDYTVLTFPQSTNLKNTSTTIASERRKFKH